MARGSSSGAAAWEETRSENFRLLAGANSYAARVLEDLEYRAEAAYARALGWFTPAEEPPLTLYLIEELGDIPTEGWVSIGTTFLSTQSLAAAIIVSPENPGLGLERSVLQLIARVAGVEATPRSLGVLRAAAGVIAAEHGIGPALAEVDALAVEQHGRAPSPPELLSAPPTAPDAAEPADLSFLTWLERTRGRLALGQFLRADLEGNPNAAQVAFGSPQLALTQTWLAELRTAEKSRTSGQDILRGSFVLLAPHWPRVVEIMAYMSVSLVFNMTVPLSQKYLIDEIITPLQFGLLPQWLGVVLLLFAVGSAANYRRQLVGGALGQTVLNDMRRKAFTQLQRLSWRFYMRSSSGDLLSRMTNDMDSLQEALSDSLPQLIFEVVSLIVASVVLLLLNWRLGLLVLVLGVPIFTIVYTRAADRLRDASRSLQGQFAEMTENVNENLNAQLVVKSFSLEQRAIAQFRRVTDELQRLVLRTIGIGAVLGASTSVIVMALRVAVLLVGAWMISRNELTLGDLVAFEGLMGEVLTPITSISGQYRNLQEATGAYERVNELLDTRTDVVEDPNAKDLAPLRHDIQLDHVTFRYEDGDAAIRDVSLTIPAGQKVAIVGPSGAGKSTMIGLLLRLYDPNQGRVLFDGRDVRESRLLSLRGQIAVVPQDTFLFNTTIGENLRLGRDGASDAEVEQAAKDAALHPVIMRTEHGYQTEVGERGVRLSGGQRQRMSIARALLRDPRVLLLDEATSALDSQTEASIMQTLEEVGKGRTTIMITHRLSSAVTCDQIYVLEFGRLVEQGTHNELMERRGLYWQLYVEQQAGLGVADLVGLPIEPQRLARVPLFSGLGAHQLTAIAMRMTPERYEARRVVVRQGEIADRLYVIGDGKVEILVEDVEGERQRVNVLSAGSYFGEIGLLSDTPARRNATVRTLTPCELFSLHQEDFANLVLTDAAIAESIAHLAAARVAQVEQFVDPSAAVPQPVAALVVRSGPDVGRVYRLEQQPIVAIGRHRDNAIKVPGEDVSRWHCQVRWTDDGYLVEDVGSSTGTFLNEQPTASALLRPGDRIGVGSTVLEFQRG